MEIFVKINTNILEAIMQKYECRRYNDQHPDDKITKLSLKMGLQWSPVDGTKNLLSEI